MAVDMHIKKDRFEDVGPRDAHGKRLFYYAGLIYEFIGEEEKFVARRYDHSWSEASFLSPQIKRGDEWHAMLFDPIPYDSPIFSAAVQYLLDTEGVQKVLILSGGKDVGYEVIEPEKLNHN